MPAISVHLPLLLVLLLLVVMVIANKYQLDCCLDSCHRQLSALLPAVIDSFQHFTSCSCQTCCCGLVIGSS